MSGAILEVRGVTVGFDGFTVLDGLDLTITRGELRFLIGPNGAGKTTLLDIITGRTRPTSGTVVFDGRVSLVGKDESSIARLGIGRKFQTPSVFGSLTVVENIELAASVGGGVGALLAKPSDPVRDRSRSVMEMVGLDGRDSTEASTLSHGERQWLEIGMLLAQDAQLLLLDEPVAGMTRAERDRTGEMLVRIAETRSVLVVEHDMTFLRQFGREVTVLHLGRTLIEGPVEVVSTDPRVIEVYLGRGARSGTDDMPEHRTSEAVPGATAQSEVPTEKVAAHSASSAPGVQGTQHGRLNVSGLSSGYGQGLTIRDISFEVDTGQVLCVLGRNGVGKSTLLRAVMGTLPALKGSITVHGTDLTTAPPHARAQNGIAYVPQGRGIFPRLTVTENLVMGLEGMVVGPRDSEHRVGAMHARFPILSTMAGRLAGTLSGGQQQQLAIARALIREPRVLILDEPTEGIQPSIIEEIEALIGALRDEGSMAILLVEQFLDFAVALADTCIVMEKGQVVARGAPRELGADALRDYLSV